MPMGRSRKSEELFTFNPCDNLVRLIILKKKNESSPIRVVRVNLREFARHRRRQKESFVCLKQKRLFLPEPTNVIPLYFVSRSKLGLEDL